MAVDDRKKSRSRFSLFLVLSLLAHLLLFVLMWLQPLPVAKKSDQVTVKVKLSGAKPGDDVPETQTPPPTQQQNAKKAEQEKKSAQAEQAKKAESSEKSKKSEKGGKSAKSEKIQKAEAKAKDQPKKQEPKKQESKKQEPKKQEPKKQESEKQQHKDASASKPRKSDDGKPRRAERPEHSLDYSQYEKEITGTESDKTQNKNPGLPDQDRNNLDYWTKRLSSMKQIDERALKRSIVVTDGANSVMDQRSQDGRKLLETLSKEQRHEYDRIMQENVGLIMKNYVKPKKDGKKYFGEIRFTIDAQGFISEANFKTRSGNEALDQAMLNALLATRKLELSRDAYVSNVVANSPVVLFYTDEDME